MTKEREALKLAQKALSNKNAPAKTIYEALAAIQKALAQPEQEPDRGVAYSIIDRFLANNLNSDEDYAKYSKALDVLYTTPPQRTWVGLTDDDKMAFLAQDFGGNRLDAMDWAEKRLKEKNT